MNDTFVFYRTFWETYLSLLGQKDEVTGEYKKENFDSAHEYLESVCRYGIEGSYETGNPQLDGLMVSVMFGVDKATDRYLQSIENGKKGGAPAKYDKMAIIDYINGGHTQKEASEKFGCNIRTVRRYVQEYNNSLKNIINEDGTFNF